ncbi:Uncharacterised protein [uncultured Flavonifractor sp.]|nr:Uncharacterised protein [uncultured Flavonifractor sp.]
MEANELIRGAYDLHVHSAPDVLPRKMNDIDMAERIRQSGMGGYAIKSHFFCTSERAELMRTLYPDVDYVGTITLNSAVGGINPTAMEMACRSGAKLVWFPTCDGEEERAHTFNSGPNKKLPFWARIIIEMKEAGIEAPTINCLDQAGRLKKNVLDTLDVIAKYNVILTTGHISHREAFALVPEATKRGVKRILITHATFPTTFYTVEEQRRFVEHGAKVEHCYTTWATGKCPWDVVVEQIRALGPEHVVLSTDLGQSTAIYPDEGMLEWAKRLSEEGFSDEAIRTMMVHNPRSLLGLE